jgi:hypothetical protein
MAEEKNPSKQKDFHEEEMTFVLFIIDSYEAFA